MSADDKPVTQSRGVRHVSAACDSCRRARIKCDGVVPCHACVVRKISCTIDASRDGRRGRKRTLDQLNSKADVLETLLNSLKSFDDTAIRDLVTFVRSDRSVDEIVQFARTIQSTSISHTSPKVRHAVLDIAWLTDEPPIRVPAKPWTNVLDDDLAVSHLISVYFAWQHWAYPSVDQDTFTKHMQRGDLSSWYCSPILVNSMLLVACMYTDHSCAFANPGDPQTRALHFLEETTKAWTLEFGKVTLSNLQALPPFISGVVALGKDRIGISFTNQLTLTSLGFVREVKKQRSRGQQEFCSEQFERSYALALWASFVIQTEVAIAWSTPLDIREPSWECRYSPEELSQPTLWRSYPNLTHETTFYPQALNLQRFRLYVIAADLRSVVLSSDPGDSPLPGFVVLDDTTKTTVLHDVDRRLREWCSNLPPEASLGDMMHGTAAGPLADLHLAHNSFRISTASHMLRLGNLTEEQKDSATENMMAACLEIAQIYKWLQQSIGFKYFSTYFTHAASLCAYNLLPILDRPEATDTFHMVIVALSAASQRWTLARGIVRMIWIEVQKRDLTANLREPTLSILRLSAVDAWGPEDHRLFEKCSYPNYAVAEEKGPILAEMGDLLQEYSRLNIDNPSGKDQDQRQFLGSAR